MTAVYKAFFVTGCDMKVKINVTVLTCDSTCEGHDLKSSLELDRVVFLCHSIVYACSEIIDGAKACDLCKADVLFFCNLADLLQDFFFRIKTKIDRISKTSVFPDKDGYVDIPKKPGLGLEIDEDMVKEVSAAYMARYIAKNIVAAGLASKCQVS